MRLFYSLAPTFFFLSTFIVINLKENIKTFLRAQFIRFDFTLILKFTVFTNFGMQTRIENKCLGGSNTVYRRFVFVHYLKEKRDFGVLKQ